MIVDADGAARVAGHAANSAGGGETQFGARPPCADRSLRWRCIGALLLGLAGRASVGQGPAIPEYAVVVSPATAAHWPRAVAALQEKHAAAIVSWDRSIDRALPALQAQRPRFACFVARPEECTREFVIAVHRLTRRLDDDPYGDCIWGILTGRDEGDLLRIVGRDAPLLVRRGAGGTFVPLEHFHSGVFWHECEAGACTVKAPRGAVEKRACPPDTTRAIVDELNGACEWFVTSGHATPDDWQIGFNFANGQLRCRDGQLFGVDLAGRRHDVRATGPRIYSAAGNCLMGRIVDRHSMALGWIHSAGVDQLLGYVVSTWFGDGGWGVNETFYLGLHGFAEAFFLNNQALVHELETRHPRSARIDFDRWDIEQNGELLHELAAQHGLRDRREVGLLWDRDTVAFYGDPAWVAKLDRQSPPLLAMELAETDGAWTFAVTALQDGEWTRHLGTVLPRRLRGPKRLDGDGLVTDDFVLLPPPGKFAQGASWRLRFRGSGD
jgi:zinc protease